MSRAPNCSRCGQMRFNDSIHICKKEQKVDTGTKAAARADSLVSTGGNPAIRAGIQSLESATEAGGRDKAFAEIERALLGTEPLDPNNHTAQVLAQHDEKIRSDAYAKGYTDGSRDYDR